MNKNSLLNQIYICPIGADGIHPTLNTVVVLNNGEWGDPRERVFDYDVIVEKWILPALR